MESGYKRTRLEFARNAMGLIVFSEIVKFATNSRQPEHGFAIRLIGLYKCDFRAKDGGGYFHPTYMQRTYYAQSIQFGRIPCTEICKKIGNSEIRTKFANASNSDFPGLTRQLTVITLFQRRLEGK